MQVTPTYEDVQYFASIKPKFKMVTAFTTHDEATAYREPLRRRGFVTAQVEHNGKWFVFTKGVWTTGPYAGLQPAPIVTPTPPVTVIREETVEFWGTLGYSTINAQKLADWCKANKMSPSPAQINTILGITAVKTWATMTELEKMEAMANFWRDEKNVVNEIITKYGIANMEAQSFYTQNESQIIQMGGGGSAIPLNWSDLLDFIPVVGLASMPVKVGEKYAVKIGEKWVLKEVMEEQGKIISKVVSTDARLSLARFTSGLTTRGVLDSIVKNWKVLLGTGTATLTTMLGMGFAVPWLGKEGIWESASFQYGELIRTGKWELAKEYLPQVKDAYEKAKALQLSTSWMNPISQKGFIDGIANMEMNIKLWESRIAEHDSKTVNIGKLRILSSPTGAKIYLDDKDLIIITPRTLYMSPGTHTIRLTKETSRTKYEDVTKTYEIEGGDDMAETIIMTKIVPTMTVTTPTGEIVATPTFKILIDSLPTRAKLWIDGVYTGHYTPSNEIELRKQLGMLTAGEHIIKVTRGGSEAEQKITTINDDNGTIILTLL